jgi:hypothetical protein
MTAASGGSGKTTRQERIDHWTEFALAVMLGIVALATAWSGYQAARWGGEQSTHYSQAGALRTESVRSSTLGGQLAQVDVAMFGNWASAYAEGNQELADFLQERFRPEFVPAFEAWLATEPLQSDDAPPSPFSMPEYTVSDLEEARQLEKEAGETFAKGQEANEQGDRYVLNTVILATVLFLAGIATRFDWLPVKALIIVAALILLVYGVYNLAIYPVA